MRDPDHTDFEPEGEVINVLDNLESGRRDLETPNIDGATIEDYLGITSEGD